jgi:hypothetical protein
MSGLKAHQICFSTKEKRSLKYARQVQARRCKVPIKELKKRTISMEKDENLCQDIEYTSDDEDAESADAESLASDDNNDLDNKVWNDDLDETTCLNDLKWGEKSSKSRTVDSRQLGGNLFLFRK